VSDDAAPVPVTVAFGRRAREFRQDRGWSLRETGTLVGLNWATLSKIENGAGTSLRCADSIALAFGMPLAVMLTPDSCGHCHGSPGQGFTCQLCGAAGPEVTG
jgi:transcriptional regulator with XRE-family HTH domain